MFLFSANLLLSLCLTNPVTTSNTSLNQAVGLYNSGAIDPLPRLDKGQQKALRAGQVVAIYRPKKSGHHAGSIGLLLTPLSLGQLWIALRDQKQGAMASLLEHRQRQAGRDDVEWLYQYLRLPWPFGARHWMLKAYNNVDLARQSHNKVWERRWSLAPDGKKIAKSWVNKNLVKHIKKSDFDNAIYTPHNRGAWFIVELNKSKRLLGFQVSTVAGGAIPDRLVAQYAVMRMDEILREIELRAKKMAPQKALCIMGADGLALRASGCSSAQKKLLGLK